MHAELNKHIEAFDQFPRLQELVSRVLKSLPSEVQEDFREDSTFQVTLEDFEPGKGWKMFMSLPTSGNQTSRCVVLRQKLEQAPEPFALYVIAHEFAHAFLRNGGWGEILDKEDAADALADSWGYAKPQQRWF